MFAAHHAQGDANKGGKLRHRARVTAIEMSFPLRDNPQRPQGSCAADKKRHEQNLGHDDVSVSDPAINPLGMRREHRSIAVERDATRAEIPRGCCPVKRGEPAPQILPAEHAGGGLLFIETEPRGNPACHLQRKIDEPRQNLFRLISHPRRDVLQRQLFLNAAQLLSAVSAITVPRSRSFAECAGQVHR
jgi:hypothetical protein